MQQNIILLIFVVSIVFNALADGIRMRDIKEPQPINGTMYHIFWVLTIISLMSLMFLPVHSFAIFSKYVLAYGLLRFGIFDFVHNKAAQKHYLYMGDTAPTDRWLSRIFGRPTAKGVLMIIRGLAIMSGAFLIQYFDKYF